MSDPDLIERIARTYYESPLLDGGTPGKWEDAHPEDRAYWRGAVAAIIGAYEADRDRPWPRFAEGGRLPTREPSDTIPVSLSPGCVYIHPEAIRRYGTGFLAQLNAPSARVNHPTQRDLDRMTGQP